MFDHTENLLLCSTSHLTEDEAQRMPDEWPVRCMFDEEGIFAKVWRDDAGEILDAEEWPGFIAVNQYAIDRGYHRILFDRDFDIVEGLQTYEW